MEICTKVMVCNLVLVYCLPTIEAGQSISRPGLGMSAAITFGAWGLTSAARGWLASMWVYVHVSFCAEFGDILHPVHALTEPLSVWWAFKFTV